MIVIWTAFSWGLPFRWWGLVHAIEMAFESIDVRRPEATELSEPGVELLEWSRLQPIEPALSVYSRFDETGVSQDAKVLGDGRLGHPELTLDVADGLFGGEQEAENRAAIGLGDDLECGFHASCIPHYVYTCQGIFK